MKDTKLNKETLEEVKDKENLLNTETEGKKVKKERSKQKIFIIVSIIFLLGCIFIYGGRFTYFYLNNKKTEDAEKNLFATTLKVNNKDSDNFKNIDDVYYFYKDAKNNYVKYSNLIWRVIKINKDKSVTMILDNPITILGYGDMETSYDESNLVNWLNNSDNGLLHEITTTEKYLSQNKVCTDAVSKISKRTCKNKGSHYFDLLSIDDYVKTGNTDSFINNGYYNYLANKDDSGNIWYINAEGKLATSEGKDLYGVKPVVTLNYSLETNGGDGSSDKPYTLSEDSTYFGSYVKLGEDTYRVYDVTDGNVKMVKTSVIKDGDVDLKHVYSVGSSKFNLSYRSSLAYYLNYTYLKNLDYKDTLIKNNYYNGYYTDDYNTSLNPMELTVGVPSIGNVMFDNESDEYFTMTGTAETSSYVYVIRGDGSGSYRGVKFNSGVLPCVSVSSESLKSGNGTMEDPYRAE